MDTREPKWLEWGRALQALTENGLTYTTNPYDVERYKQIREIAADMLAGYMGLEPALLTDLFTGQQGYATPKVDTRGAVFRDHQILLVSENQDAGRWTLPGGWADMGDSPSVAVEREIREEAGYETHAVKLAAVYDRSKHGHLPVYYETIYKLFFVCEITGGEAVAPNLETGGVEFFAEDALPELSISRVTPAEIHMLFEHYRHPERPTEFD